MKKGCFSSMGLPCEKHPCVATPSSASKKGKTRAIEQRRVAQSAASPWRDNRQGKITLSAAFPASMILQSHRRLLTGLLLGFLEQIRPCIAEDGMRAVLLRQAAEGF